MWDSNSAKGLKTIFSSFIPKVQYSTELFSVHEPRKNTERKNMDVVLDNLKRNRRKYFERRNIKAAWDNLKRATYEKTDHYIYDLKNSASVQRISFVKLLAFSRIERAVFRQKRFFLKL